MHLKLLWCINYSVLRSPHGQGIRTHDLDHKDMGVSPTGGKNIFLYGTKLHKSLYNPDMIEILLKKDVKLPNGSPRGRVVKARNLKCSKSHVISPLWVRA